MTNRLNEQIQKSIVEGVQGFFGESITSIKSQIEENRSALRDLEQRFTDSDELQRYVQEIAQAYSNVEYALQEAESAVGGQQQQANQGHQHQEMDQAA